MAFDYFGSIEIHTGKCSQKKELGCYFDVLFRYTSNPCTYILYIDLDMGFFIGKSLYLDQYIIQLSMKIMNMIIYTR